MTSWMNVDRINHGICGIMDESFRVNAGPVKYRRCTSKDERCTGKGSNDRARGWVLNRTGSRVNLSARRDRTRG